MAAPASAALMMATFTGTVDRGSDFTNFFGLGESLGDAAFTAVFKYDTTLGNPTSGYDGRIGGPKFGGVSPIFSATLRINGVTDIFDTFGNGAANVFIGDDTWEQTFLYTDATNVVGGVTNYNFLQLFVLSAPTPTLLTTPYEGGNKTFDEGPLETNMVTHYRTAGDVKLINYGATLAPDFVRIQAVPEPGTWAMLILGFFSAGSLLRRRRAIA